MNPTIELILKRRSVRAYEKKEIAEETKKMIIDATLRAPTAGNLMLYSIVEITDQTIKDTLAKSCDNQPFIAKAPWILLFLADYQRWFDYFEASGVRELCTKGNMPMRQPEEGDLFLACCDAVIAAQTAVIAAESLGIGSCYIGDIMEKYEVHKELFDLPKYAFPICLLCFGYPTKGQKERELTPRYERRFVVHENQYRRLNNSALEEMHHDQNQRIFQDGKEGGASNEGQFIYNNKFNASFSQEMSRSVRMMLKAWKED
jgi:FMN reductase (NADPH)/FMN reductase [NAD(P)H]